MNFELEDLFGDTIRVQPEASEGVLPKINIMFIDDEGNTAEMLLSDRQWAALRKAGNQAIKESERMG